MVMVSWVCTYLHTYHVIYINHVHLFMCQKNKKREELVCSYAAAKCQDQSSYAGISAPELLPFNSLPLLPGVFTVLKVHL